MSDKLFRIIIIVLIVSLVGLEVNQTIINLSKLPSECITAHENAKDILNLSIPLISEYETSVYDRAENINQQQFFAAEYNFMTLQVIALQNKSIIELLTYCN